MKPHKHAEVIKAWADGAGIQIFNGIVWIDILEPTWVKNNEYRVKPATPKWPQTTMSEDELSRHITYRIATGISGPETGPFYTRLANEAIAHACETGQVIPIEMHNEKIKSQGLKWLEALRSGDKRERELGDMLHDAVKAVHELDPHRKVRMPVPKPTVLVKYFNSGEITGRDTEERDIAIAINVRAACLVKHPGVLSNDELNKIIATVK